MKHFFFLILFVQTLANAQECTFDLYQKRGGLYYFSTFYQNYNPKQVREGICQKTANGKPYEYREFKNGQLQVERLYNFDNGKVYSEFKRLQKDSIIGQLTYKPDGSQLELIQTFYLNSDKKRCFKEEHYQRGKLHSVKFIRNLTNYELVKAGYAARPEHLIDADGYCDVRVPFGPEITYHPNGRIQQIIHHEFLITDSPSGNPTQTGPIVAYSENGLEIQRGTYKRGQPNGEFIYHHLNGKLSAKHYFENGLPVGNWIDYYEDGSLQSTIDYGENYYWPSGYEKRYDQKGNAVFEKVIYKDGTGFQKTWNDEGLLVDHIIYLHGPNEISEHVEWYNNGKVKSIVYYRPHNDTASVSYFEDGFLKSLHLQRSGYHFQETRTYFPNHQLATYNKTTFEGFWKQLILQYNEKGVCLTKDSIALTEKFHWENWNNGQPKKEQQFKNNLLNGWWMEYDSLGKETKKCHYSNGFRDQTCEVQLPLVLQPLDKQLEKQLKAIVVNCIARQRYNDSVVLRNKDIALRVELLKDVCRYLNTYYPQEQLHFTDSTTTFRYYFTTSDAFYQPNAKKIDSLFQWMGWKLISPVQRNNGISCKFESNIYYSSAALDSIFKGIFPPGNSFFNLENQFYPMIDIDVPWGNQHTTLTFERKEAEKAWIVAINNQKVVHYDSGEMELFNDQFVGVLFNHLKDQEHLIPNKFHGY